MQIKPNKRKYKITLTKDQIDAVLKDIEDGSPNKYAAVANGISDRHFYDCVLQGICDMENGQSDTLYAYLARSLRRIEQKEIKECRKVIRMCPKGHTGAQWTLEHAYPCTFGNNAAAKEMDERLRKLETPDDMEYENA